jgi:hypothetical protein
MSFSWITLICKQVDEHVEINLLKSDFLLSNIPTWLSVDRFVLVTGFIEHWWNITANNPDSLTKLYTPKITAAKSSQSLLAIAW